MKKQICYLFIFCLLLSCFAGCAGQPSTPTPADATPSETQTADTVIQQEQPTQESQQADETADKQTNQENQTVQNAAKKRAIG